MFLYCTAAITRSVHVPRIIGCGEVEGVDPHPTMNTPIAVSAIFPSCLGTGVLPDSKFTRGGSLPSGWTPRVLGLRCTSGTPTSFSAVFAGFPGTSVLRLLVRGILGGDGSRWCWACSSGVIKDLRIEDFGMLTSFLSPSPDIWQRINKFLLPMSYHDKIWPSMFFELFRIPLGLNLALITQGFTGLCP